MIMIEWGDGLEISYFIPPVRKELRSKNRVLASLFKPQITIDE
jgi:hypothetical protein